MCEETGRLGVKNANRRPLQRILHLFYFLMYILLIILTNNMLLLLDIVLSRLQIFTGHRLRLYIDFYLT